MIVLRAVTKEDDMHMDCIILHYNDVIHRVVLVNVIIGVVYNIVVYCSQ